MLTGSGSFYCEETGKAVASFWRMFVVNTVSKSAVTPESLFCQIRPKFNEEYFIFLVSLPFRAVSDVS